MLPILLEVRSQTCRSCKKMEPILRELQSVYAEQFKVVFVDLSKNQETVKKYKVESVPTQIFLDSNGTVLFRHSGELSSEEILARWERLGYKFSGE